MIKQIFYAESYWKVIVWYNLDYSLFDVVAKSLHDYGMSDKGIHILYKHMKSRKAKAVTYSNFELCVSIVLFNTHESRLDYVNSIVHEAEHIKQAMLNAYQVIDTGEPPAYTIGYLVGRMWEIFRDFACVECNKD